MFLLDTPTPRRRAPPRKRPLRVGGPDPKVSALSGPPRRCVLHLGEPLYLGVAKLRLGVPVSSILVPLFR